MQHNTAPEAVVLKKFEGFELTIIYQLSYRGTSASCITRNIAVSQLIIRLLQQLSTLMYVYVYYIFSFPHPTLHPSVSLRLPRHQNTSVSLSWNHHSGLRAARNTQPLPTLQLPPYSPGHRQCTCLTPCLKAINTHSIKIYMYCLSATTTCIIHVHDSIIQDMCKSIEILYCTFCISYLV